MQAVINKLILAVGFQNESTKTESSTVLIPIVLAAALAIMMAFCLTQNINLFAE